MTLAWWLLIVFWLLLLWSEKQTDVWRERTFACQQDLRRAN